MKENNEVVIAEKDTKKLNAGIAVIALQNMLKAGLYRLKSNGN